MPIYEYRCAACDNEYEMREGFDAPALQKCPNCGGKARRVIRATPIVFKGSGFYVTDSRKAVAGTESGSEAKSDAKPESKPDSSSTDGAAPKADKPAKTDKPAKADASATSS